MDKTIKDYLNRITVDAYDDYLQARKDKVIITEQILGDNQGFIYVKKLDNGVGIRVSYEGDFFDEVITISEQYLHHGNRNFFLINGKNQDIINYFLQQQFSVLYPSYNMELLKVNYQIEESDIELKEYDESDSKQYLELLGEAFTPIRKQLQLQPHNWYMNNQEESKKGFIESKNKNQLFGYFKEQELIGVLEIVQDELETIAIKQSYQGQGLGLKLLYKAINIIFDKGFNKAKLAVLGGNEKATSLYEKVGFTINAHQVILKQDINMLFIGNSFTYFNDLPTIVEDIGKANNVTIHTKQVTYGGIKLSQYLQHRSSEYHEVIDQLDSKDWDYVILQDQSKATIDNTDEFHQSIEIFNKMIISRNSKTVLYSTWSYKDNSRMLYSAKLTYQEMYKHITKEYQEASVKNNTLLAPVGSVFDYMNTHYPEVNIYDPDDYHPNLLGSFLGAYTFYNILIGKDEHFMNVNIEDNILTLLKGAVLTVLQKGDKK